MKPRVLILESGEEARHLYRNALFGRCELIEAAVPAMGPRVLATREADVVIVGSVDGSTMTSIELTRELRDVHASVPILLIACDTSEELAIAALRSGANDYLRRPIVPSALLRAVEGAAANRERTAQGNGHRNGQPFIGTSGVMQQLRAYLLKVACSDCNVLITGETGTGKEVVARFLHLNSARRDRGLVCINCAAVPEMLIESELFGYERGAFTGATSMRQGKVAAADGGTLFLDEIGEMCPRAQAAVLRMIEIGELQMLGSRAPSQIDVRIIAATNEELEARVERKTFRADLFYRLNVARIHLPPLRERREDIVPLVEHFVRELNQRSHQNVKGFTTRAIEAILRYQWPGNIRELRNALEAAFINQPAPAIDVCDLPPNVAADLHPPAPPLQAPTEKEELMLALQAAKGNKTLAAEMLHCSRMTLYRRMQKFGVASRLSH